ncbi:efflux transporter, outer membrane factor (OMF) lipoprotein, NodT family [Variovorax sp. OK605]|uniref:efflux transporter outer membrane subunit n=1 Tax=Variovorax sp. OK605 TaxID=1855317 RepID=UPI0008EB416E|nr:efflux transporter outer membrane subunit [Variovorax sp. OK605]SFQ08293.1 efflux transporter, outer membrane factor (OMF) lipoprotein, NodT family [Variovorax sp. OK605]
MRFLLLPLVLALSGCSLAPKLVTPDTPVPAMFPMQAHDAAPGVHAADLGWRTMFKDSQLQRLIELSLANNRDLRIAALNVEAAQAQFRVQRASRLPALEVNGSASRERALGAGNPGSTAAPRSSIQEQTSLALGLSAFEIDLFGRVRSLSDAAFARYLASDEGRRSVQLSLVSAVADACFSERLAHSQSQLSQRTFAGWQQSLDLARRLKQADQNSGLEVAQAEGQVATAEADLEARERALAQSRNALQLLIGGEIPEDLLGIGMPEDPPVVTRLPAGLPSDLLSRRPDIRQAEQNLAAANASIGAARAAFFPRLSLTASLGYASPALSGLVGADHRTWRFAPQITQPLFQGGSLRAELRLAEIRKSTAILEYERAVQTAFREVADGLAGTATYGRQIDAQTRVVASAQKRLDLSTLRHRYGLEGRLELLDAQRQLYAASQALLDLRRNEIGNAVLLYKALGGGLLEKTVEPTASPVEPHSAWAS